MGTIFESVVFRHSGKLGDIVYCLPAVSAFPGSTLLINADGAHLHPKHVEVLLPLLGAQSYIGSAAPFQGEGFDHDFDIFRRLNVAFFNLADCQLMTLNLPPSRLRAPWLQADRPETLGGNRVIFARSAAWAGAPGVFEELYRAYGKGAIFVGTTTEWKAFQRDIGPIGMAPTANLLDLARVIAGCRLFIGNQSCPLAIAAGLGVPVMLAVYAPTPNCVFYRPNFYALWSATQVPGSVRDFETGQAG